MYFKTATIPIFEREEAFSLVEARQRWATMSLST
jgi:hypothetical protein